MDKSVISPADASVAEYRPATPLTHLLPIYELFSISKLLIHSFSGVLLKSTLEIEEVRN